MLDIETTGLDPKQGHRMIEFAAVEIIDGGLTNDYLHLYINPERSIDKGAIEVHGITNEMVYDKPVFSHVAPKILEYVKGSEVIIHNAPFDLGFLNYQFALIGIEAFSSVFSKITDTLQIARKKYPGARNNLDALCDRLKVDRSDRNFHGALKDCYLLAQVYNLLLREQKNLLDHELLEQTVLVKNNNKNCFSQVNRDISCNLVQPDPSQIELDNHSKYMNSITQAR